MPHPGAAATAEPNKWRPLKSRRGRRDLRPPGRRAPGHLARLFRAKRHGGRSVRDPVSLPRPPRPSPLRLARHGPSGSAEEKSVPGRSARRQPVTAAPLEARTSALRTWGTAGPRDPQNWALRMRGTGAQYAPWVRRRERSSVTAVGDIAACIETRVRTVRTRTGPRRSSGGTSAVELSGRGRKPPRLPAGPPAAAAARHGGRAIYAARGSARRRRSADGGPRSKPRERCQGSSRGGAMGPARDDGRSGASLRVTAQAKSPPRTTLFRPQYLQCG